MTSRKSTSVEPQQVRKRRVFYIPGYDPMAPRRYRELYRSEGAEQAEISGYEIEVKGVPDGMPYRWKVASRIDGAETQTEVEFLQWSDIVQKSMDRSIPQTYLLLLRTIWIYVSTGTLFRLMRLRKGPIIAALYPVFFLLLQLVIALIAGACAVWAAGLISPALVAWPLGVVATYAVLWWFRQQDSKFYAYYLLHDYAFSAQYYGATPPRLSGRLAEFQARLSEALSSDVDEVLVVGHSSGAHLGVSVLANLLRAQDLPKEGPKLAFLSLGQVVPMASFLPKADVLRRDLGFLSQHGDVTWVDVSAPGDGCTFALCDPVLVSGAGTAGKTGPLVISASFSQSLSPEKFKSIKRRFFRLHFQYLCAFDRPKDYDYFQITAGPTTLAARYEGRVASKSRIETSLSGYSVEDAV